MELRYEDLKVGEEYEYQDFWHSGILSWRKCVLMEVEIGTRKERYFDFGERNVSRNSYKHRMRNVRKPITRTTH